MEKLTKQDGESLDIINKNIETLKTVFPEAFSEDGINFETLKQLLGNKISEEEEKYSFTWHGKKKARQIALTPSLGTLRPCKEESVDWDTTKNLFIEGDNLEVLKLLQKSYANKVKMIYIDPPYNTGKDFVYKDKFQDNLDNYLRYTGQKSSEGLKTSSNPETSGRYHTNWLNMMYPRLKLARNLLKDDGVIFISIDDHEVMNLRKICDEILGEENFVTYFLWKKKSTTSNVKDAEVSPQGDYQLCYKKSLKAKIKQRVKIASTRHYANKDTTGSYRTIVIEKKDSGIYKRNTMKFQILGKYPRKGKRWQIGKEKAQELENKNRFIWDGEKILLKIYDFEESNTFSAQPNILYNYGSTDSGSKLANIELFNIPGLFDNPKPIELITHFIKIVTNKNNIILDFFAGSCTTAHATLDLNKEDDGNRRFIMVQLPELANEKSEAFKAGYKNIADIGKERIRRVIKKIKKENPKYKGDNTSVDLGFKVFKLDTSNIRAWNSKTDNLTGTLFENINHLVEGRSEKDVLYELLLKRGVDLTIPIKEKTIIGKTIYNIGQGSLFVCLDDKINRQEAEDVAMEIIKWRNEVNENNETLVIFKDSAFKDNVTKSNLMAILKQNNINHIRSL